VKKNLYVPKDPISNDTILLIDEANGRKRLSSVKSPEKQNSETSPYKSQNKIPLIKTKDAGMNYVPL
jgi:hypothetical protein